MPKYPPDIILVTVPNKMMSALRAYWTVMDLDQGPHSTHFWDLRYGAVNRWQSEDVHSPHVRYTLAFKRSDDIDDLTYANEYGKYPPAPDSWKIIFWPGTFPESFNEEYDRWMRDNMPKVARIEDQKGPELAWDYVKKHAPPEYLPNPENWTPDQAAEELREIMPKAIELFESERPPIDWRPKGFVVQEPEEG